MEILVLVLVVFVILGGGELLVLGIGKAIAKAIDFGTKEKAPLIPLAAV